MKLRKGDTVKILTGKDRGKTGKILKIMPAANKISVEGLNLYKKHVRPKRQGEKGEVVQVARPLDASNAAFLCQHCHQATRLGSRQLEKAKIRYCRKCQNPV